MRVILFWCAGVLVAYAYLGYPLILLLWSRFCPRSHRTDELTPFVDVLIAAYNEQDEIEAKIANTLALDYPREQLHITVVTDGSTDATPALVASHADKGVALLHQAQRRGKGAAIARAYPHLRGDAILFTDANCALKPETLRCMVRHLADPQVGGVSGAKRFTASEGEGLYWRYESWLKALDSRCGSVMGAPGEVWLARREAYRPPPPDIVLEDLYASVELVARGWRLVNEPKALSYEQGSPNLRAEWRRRVRNAAGGWQAVVRLTRVLSRYSPLVFFQFLSHRALRWIAVPVALIVLFLMSACLWQRPFYATALLLQSGFYVMALAGLAWVRLGKKAGWWAAPLVFCMLHAAALAGGWRYLRGQQTVLWEKVRD